MTSQKITLAKLFTAQLFSGAGIASGYAVGGLLAEQITGRTAMAGFAQMSVILGAGLVAYPSPPSLHGSAGAPHSPWGSVSAHWAPQWSSSVSPWASCRCSWSA